jgi:hypothetical protein
MEEGCCRAMLSMGASGRVVREEGEGGAPLIGTVAEVCFLRVDIVGLEWIELVGVRGMEVRGGSWRCCVWGLFFESLRGDLKMTSALPSLESLGAILR